MEISYMLSFEKGTSPENVGKNVKITVTVI